MPFYDIIQNGSRCKDLAPIYCIIQGTLVAEYLGDALADVPKTLHNKDTYPIIQAK